MSRIWRCRTLPSAIFRRCGARSTRSGSPPQTSISSPISSPAQASTIAAWRMPARSLSPRRSHAAFAISIWPAISDGCTSTSPAASMRAGTITSGTSASWAWRKTARNITKSRSVAVPMSVRCRNGRKGAELAHYLDWLALVALVFPNVRDGRAYSQARILRERHQFRGELRATGQVLRDQLLFLQRAGFDAFEVTKNADAAAFAEAVQRYSVFYQPTGDGRRITRQTRAFRFALSGVKDRQEWERIPGPPSRCAPSPACGGGSGRGHTYES